MRSPYRIRMLVVSSILVAAMPGCGGGGGGSPTGPSTPTTTRRQLTTVNFTVAGTTEANRQGLVVDAFLAELTITGGTANPLEMIADWTFASNDIDVVLFRGNCTPQAFVAQNCSEMGSTTSTTAKPEHLSVNNVASGTYTVAIVNFGPTNESGVLQIFGTQ